MQKSEKVYTVNLYRTQQDLVNRVVLKRLKGTGVESQIIKDVIGVLLKYRYRCAIIDSNGEKALRVENNGMGISPSVYKFEKVEQRICNIMASLLSISPSIGSNIGISEIGSGTQILTIDSKINVINDKEIASNFFKELCYIPKPVSSVMFNKKSSEFVIGYETGSSDTYFLENGVLYSRYLMSVGD